MLRFQDDHVIELREGRWNLDSTLLIVQDDNGRPF